MCADRELPDPVHIAQILGIPKREAAHRVAASFSQGVYEFEAVYGKQEQGAFLTIICTTVKTMAEIYEYGPIDRRLEKALAVFRGVVGGQDAELLKRIDEALESVSEYE
jgi:hypothetical protein